MNKRFLLVAALCAAMNLSSFADKTNLALNKTVVASSEGQAAKNAVDGNLDSRWEVNTTNEIEVTDEANDYTVSSGHWIYVDLGAVTEFNTLRIKWDAAYAKEFKVFVADDVNAETGEPNWKEETILTKAELLTNFTKNYTYSLDNTVSARYVKIQAVKLGFAGNWFSICELGVYNLTAEEKVSNLTSFKADKETVAPGEEFNVTATDQWDKDMTGDDITYTCTNATDEGNGKFKADAAGEVTVTATDKQNNSKTIKLVAYVPALTSVKVYPSIVVTGVETPLTFTVKDQQGKDYTEYTTDVEDNKFTASADGAHEVTIKSGDVEKKVKVYAVSSVDETPTLGADDMSIFIDGTEGHGTSDAAWNEHYDKQEVIEINGKKAIRVANAGTFGINKGSISDTDYTELNFDIYSTTDVEDAYVKYEGAGAAYENLKFSLKAGQWNHVSLNVEGATKFNSWIQMYVGKNGADNNPDLLVANVYLKKAAASTGVVIGSADANGFISVKGTITADDLATLAATDGTAFNLTKATLGEGVTKVAFKNPNAIIQVAGTVENNVGIPAANWGETKNVVVFQGWYFPVKQLELTDGYPVYRTYFISTSNSGFKYTRQLAAQKYATVYMPKAVPTLPEGVKAYEFAVDAEDANNVILKEVTTLGEKVPYIVYNSNDVETALEAAGTGDMDFRESVAPDKTTAVGNLNVIGTFDYFTGADKTATIYGIQNQTESEITLKKIGAEGVVCPFRVYFSVNETAGAKPITFSFDGGATGIKNINAVDAAKAGNVYSIDGKLVKANAQSTEGLAKGVYVINGKKYIVK